jgi:hypothetical protein
MKDSIDRAKALLASFDTDCACIACEEPCASCQDALCRYEDILRWAIGAVKALKRQRALLVSLAARPPELIEENQISYVVGDDTLAELEELFPSENPSVTQ